MLNKTIELKSDLIDERLRKPYTRPQVEIIPLLPAQTLLGQKCHGGHSTGPVQIMKQCDVPSSS